MKCRARFGKWKECVLQKRLIETVAKRILCGKRGRELRKGFITWKTVLMSKTMRNNAARVVLMGFGRMAKNLLVVGFYNWLRSIKENDAKLKEVRRTHLLLRDCLGKIRSSRLRAGWIKWIALIDGVKGAIRVLRVFKSCVAGRLSRGWRRWREYANAANSFDMLKLVHKKQQEIGGARVLFILDRWGVVKKGRAWRIWKEFVMRESLLSRGITQKQYYCLKVIILKVRGFITQSVVSVGGRHTNTAANSSVYCALLQATHVNELKGFMRWKEFVEKQKRNIILVETNKWKNRVIYEKLGCVATNCENRSVRRGWAKWRNSVGEGRKLKGRVELFRKIIVRLARSETKICWEVSDSFFALRSPFFK